MNINYGGGYSDKCLDFLNVSLRRQFPVGFPLGCGLLLRWSSAGSRIEKPLLRVSRIQESQPAFLHCLWLSRLTVWPGLPCQKLINEQRLAAIMVMKQTKPSSKNEVYSMQFSQVVEWESALIKAFMVTMCQVFCWYSMYGQMCPDSIYRLYVVAKERIIHRFVERIIQKYKIIILLQRVQRL